MQNRIQMKQTIDKMSNVSTSVEINFPYCKIYSVSSCWFIKIVEENNTDWFV